MKFTIGHWLAVYYALVGVGGLGWLVSLWRARRVWVKRRGAKAPDKGIDTSPCPLPGRGGEGKAGQSECDTSPGALGRLVRRTSSGLRPPSPQGGEGKLPGRGGEGEATLRQTKGGATHECAGNR